MDRYKFTPQFQTDRGIVYGLWVPPIKNLKLQTYTIVEGDRLDLLAQRFLNDATLWWVIAFINGIINPFHLNAGDVISVPTSVEFYEA